MIPNRRIPDIFGDVRQFLKLSQPGMMSEMDGRPQLAAMKLAWKLIDEEVNKELKPTLDRLIAGDWSFELMADLLDHYLDVIYVAAWAIEVFGLPGNAGWNHVQERNMAKFPLEMDRPIDPETSMRAIPMPLDIPEYQGVLFDVKVVEGRFVITNAHTGKVMKPRGWTPPNIWEVMHAVRTINSIRTMPDLIADPFMREYFHAMEKRFDEGKVQL